MFWPSGHCTRYNEDTTSNVLPLEPQHCHTNRGRPRTTYIDTFKGETGLDNTKEIRDATLDQSACQNIFFRMTRDDFWATLQLFTRFT